MSVSRKQRADRKFAAHFRPNALSADLRAERACKQYRHELEKLMDCTMAGNLKNHGYHGRIETPKRPSALAILSTANAASYLKSTAVMRVDTVKQVRTIVFGGRVVGQVGYDTMTALLENNAHQWERVPGTNVVEYRFTK